MLRANLTVDCETCASAVARAAVLAVKLRKVAGRVHVLEQHPGDLWARCRMQPCQEIAELLAERRQPTMPFARPEDAPL